MRSLLHVILLGFFAVGAIQGCGPKKEEKFEINVVPDKLNLIDGTWYKCGSVPSDADLSKFYFTAGKINFEWKSSSNSFIVQQVKVTIEGSGDAQDISLSGDELVAMFSTYESPVGSGNIVIPANTDGTTDCGLRVGGISLADENSAAFLSARVRIKGIEVDSGGDSVGNVSGEQTIDIEYEP